MFENAKWIRAGACDAPLIRKEFYVENVAGAELYICGLGYFEVYMNGQKVSCDVLSPVRSEYEKRQWEEEYDFGNRTYYVKYDVEAYLQSGKNVMVVMLGNGWYNQIDNLRAGKTNYDLPKLCFTLTVGDVTLFSDGTEKWSPSHIVYNNIFFGEKQDLRLLNKACMLTGYDDANWQRVALVPEIKINLVEQKCPPDRVIRRIQPVLLCEDSGRKLYDAGENITGWAKIRVCGDDGETVLVRYTEEIDENLQPIFSTAGWAWFKDGQWEGQIQENEYICSGEEQICHPHFTYHGFRYFEVFGKGAAECVEVVHTDVDVVAEFTCDNENINWLFEAYKRTQLGNMIQGVPMDCPTRERVGYTGDGHVASDAAMLILDSEAFYRKWIYDILDAQDKKTGHAHNSAPAYGFVSGGAASYAGAIVLVPYYFYQHFVDKEILKEAYPYMLTFAEYLKSRTENSILVSKGERGGFLGDWASPEDMRIPPSYVNTYYFAKCLIYMKEIAGIIGCEFTYDVLLEELKQGIVNHYYDEESNCFCGGVQGADVFAIDLGIGNEAMMEKLAKYYDDAECFDTGIFATYLLIKLLFEKGYANTAVKLLSSEKKDTFGYMRCHGATTLWERWRGDDYSLDWNSHNHPMLGGCTNQLFYQLLGFQVTEKELVIEPKIGDGLHYVSGSIKCKRGQFSALYKRENDTMRCILDVRTDEKVIFKFKNHSYELKNGKNEFVL
ncbi:MAG: family 78 glycoside hydrolase catalytic domain [Clostridia bacterium]|nr:family 78 glycoside hydrolase catalytic domain [Clostridia bacterium]